jgi:integrase
MSGTVKFVTLENRTARMRLKRDKMFWRSLGGNLSLGYSRRTREPGMWKARVYLGDERYRITSLTWADDRGEPNGRDVLDFEQACAAARTAFSAAMEAGEEPVVTVGDACRAYVAWLRIHRRTADDAERRFARLLGPLKRVPLAELSTPALSRWRDGLLATPAMVRTAPGQPQRYKAGTRARSSVNRVWANLRAALALAFHEGHVASDAAWRRIKLLDRAGAKKREWLSIEAGKRLIDTAQGDFKILVTGALMTGMRYGEMRALLVGDYAHQKLHIRESKSGRPRDVVLNGPAIAFFEKLTAGRNRNDFIFLRHGRQWKPSDQLRPMREVCQKAGISPAVSFHGLRHSYCANSIMAGMTMVALAENVGHSSIRMLERHYKHLSREYLDQIIKAAAPV